VFWIAVGHCLLAFFSFTGIATIMPVIWIQEEPLRNAFKGAPLKEVRVPPKLRSKVNDPNIFGKWMLLFGVPLLGLTWFLKAAGYTESAAATAALSMAVGWLYARLRRRFMSDR